MPARKHRSRGAMATRRGLLCACLLLQLLAVHSFGRRSDASLPSPAFPHQLFHMPAADRRQMREDVRRQELSVGRANSARGNRATADDLGINARDFGARGDGVSDDTAALQAAIDAALERQRSLVVPAGNYSVSEPLQVHFRRGMLRLTGESMYNTIISAAANFSCGATVLQQYECAVLHLPGEQTALYPPWRENFGKTTTDHEISHIGLAVGTRAKYGLYAPLITRSRFVAVDVSGAAVAGIMLGYGWCNYLLEVRVSANTLGILLVNAANNVNVVNAIVEANYGAGIVLDSGYQVNLEGNVIEGNKGPAIVATRMYALTVQSNYFESNNEYQLYNLSYTNPDEELPVSQDLLLGASISNYPWVAPAFNSTETNLSFTTGPAASACVGVTVTGNHFSCGGVGFGAVLLGAVHGARITSNTGYWHGQPEFGTGSELARGVAKEEGAETAPATQCALLSTGGNCSRFFAQDISFVANSPSFLYLDDGRHGVVSAGFWPMIDIRQPTIGNSVFGKDDPLPCVLRNALMKTKLRAVRVMSC